ncbi:MAG: transposase [Geminicoccaceae bacterium]
MMGRAGSRTHPEKGDIVILDNLSSHKVAGVRDAIEARGAKLNISRPYSPDLNPIEQVFAKLKFPAQNLRANSRCPRTRIATGLNLFSPAECANYMRNSGYST